jgi:hypothetical protein
MRAHAPAVSLPVMRKLLPLLLAVLVFPAAAQAATCAEYPCFVPIGPVPAGSTITSFSGSFEDSSYVQLELQQGGQYVDSSAAFTTGAGAASFETYVMVPDSGTYTAALKVYEGAATDLRITYAKAEPAPTPSPQPGPGTQPGPAPQPATGFTIDSRAVLAPDGRSLRVFTSNELDEEIDGRIGVAGQKSAPISAYDYHSREDFTVPLGRKQAKRLLKKGKAAFTVQAKTSGGTFTQKVRAIRGGSAGYDGTYRGPGPLVIVVKRGVVVTVSETLNLSCPGSGQFMSRAMGTGLGFPALVGKDGSFDHKASYSSDTFTYRGKLSKHGTSKGYLSLFHTELGLSPDGKLRPEQCYQADNWEAKRV